MIIGIELLNDPRFKPEYDAAEAELDASSLDASDSLSLVGRAPHR